MTDSLPQYINDNLFIIARPVKYQHLPVGTIHLEISLKPMIGAGRISYDDLLVPNGQSYDPEEYPELYRIIGSNFSRDGKPCVPDLRGRIV